ncbi:Pesticin receptor precursor [Tsuneonella dongtanensis]|uniref:Pesticin receptor n=1 Tax=Tsuneonella dongtanensis TaxID=692370 RepID=A0A1B2AAJ7_9SPHN|nr:Pesticin receptor precursor [Tsuneonella dongtanensis]
MSRMSVSAVALGFASTLAIGAYAAPVSAQDQAADPAAEEANDGEIIVTARRREERLQDVPIAVTAISGAALEAVGAIDITDVQNQAPNVTLENSRGTNSTLTAFIRGVGQQDPVSGFEAGVGIYLDDVYLNRPQAGVLDIYDVERVEVLRGPQGTLYGRNTIGGAVKYVTKRLPQDFALKVRASYGTYDQADLVVTASTPLNDLIRVGVSGARLSRGGFGDNLTLAGVENYNKDVWAGRASLEIGGYGEPVLIRISGDYTRDQSDPRNGHRLIPGLLSGAPVLDDVFDTRAGLASPEQDVEAYGVAMNVSVDLGDAFTLRSISAWRRDTSSTPIDFDSLPAVDVDVPALYRNEQTSQEFQVLYDSGPLSGLVGFYYLGAKSRTDFDVILATTGTLLSLPGLNAFTSGDVRTSTWSVFGDFTFDLSDQLSLSAGGRYTSDIRRSRILRQTKIGGASPLFGGTAVPIATVTDFRGRAKFTDFNPRASVSFKPTPDHMVYASYAQGFKGGSFDPRGDARIAPDTDRNGVRSYQEIYDFFLFDPETVDSYEIGYKGTFMGGNGRVALTGFYGDYTDVQIPGSVGVDANGDGVFESFAGVTTNAGKARFKGVELETYLRFAQGFAGSGSSLNFTGSLGYIDGEYLEFILNGVDVSDLRRIQNTPKWTAAGTLGASVPVASGDLSLSSTVSYRSATNQFETPSPFLDQPGYALLDASIVWTAPDDRFSLGVHGKNLTDKQYITSGYQFGTVAANGTFTPTLGREGIATAFYGNPRQVFVTGTVKF